MQHPGKENCWASHLLILSKKKKHSEKTYRIRMIGLKDRNSVLQTLVHEPFDKHTQRCMSKVQLQISAFFFIIPVIILPNFLTGWKSPLLLSGPSILTLGITSSWQITLITLPALKINLHRINSAVAGGETTRLAHPPEKSHTQTLKVCLLNGGENAAINMI